MNVIRLRVAPPSQSTLTFPSSLVFTVMSCRRQDPLLIEDSDARNNVKNKGFKIAEQGHSVTL